MKHQFCLLLASVAVLASCAKGEYRISGSLKDFRGYGYEVDSVVLYVNGGNVPVANEERIAAAIVETDSFYITGETDRIFLAEVTFYLKKAGEQTPFRVPVVLEPGHMTFDLRDVFFAGTPLNNDVLGFRQKLMTSSSVEEALAALDTVMALHKADPVGVLSLSLLVPYISPGQSLSYINELSEEMQQTSIVSDMRVQLEMKGKSSEGQPFIDFEATYEGRVQRLSDYVVKGKFVLVDFWASWCGPCRAEIPNLINIYNRYKGDKFEVIGVATWDKPNDTKRAIAEMGIPYPQIMNAQKAGSDAYDIEGIPEIILFGPDGTILKRGLRGEAIEAEVKAVLGL